jgi:single-strand DNA-binding protein
MALLNRIVLIGRLTRDPELRYTPQGVPVASFSLAVDRSFTNQAGQRETDFVDCVAWRKLGETVGNHLTKGRLAAVEGRLQIRSYDAQDGTKRRVAEVIADSVQFLDRPKDSAAAAPADAEPVLPDGLPDDLPF